MSGSPSIKEITHLSTLVPIRDDKMEEVSGNRCSVKKTRWSLSEAFHPSLSASYRNITLRDSQFSRKMKKPHRTPYHPPTHASSHTDTWNRGTWHRARIRTRKREEEEEEEKKKNKRKRGEKRVISFITHLALLR